MTACTITLTDPEPCALTVRVTAGLAWTSPTMTRADASPWPSGLRLVFAGGQEWTASVNGGSATIAATAEQVAAIPSGVAVTLRDDTTVYGTGRIHVRRMPV